MWIPKKWDLSLSALSQYTTPALPAENEWIDRSKVRPRRISGNAEPEPVNGSSSASSSTPQSTSVPASSSRRRRRPPSRRLIRHVLRARAEAAKALASMFDQLEKSPDGKRVSASAHLARAYGGVEPQPAQDLDTTEDVLLETVGWRHAREVVDFLRKRGARVAQLEERVEGDWAALSSEGDQDSDSVDAEKDDLVFVAPG